MDLTVPDKEYFRIGEVSRILGVDPYVVRYWESEFKSVKPMRTKSDQRLYRRKDVQELLIIKNLLYTERFTINGAKKQLLKMKGDVAKADEDHDRKRLVEIKRGLLQVRKIVGEH